MHNRFAVIGLGQFGLAIARSLAAQGAEVLAIDNDESHIEIVKEEVSHAVTLDATDIKALKSQNINDVDAVVVAIGEDFEALVLTAVQLLELKIERVIARAANEQQRKILMKLGITEILSPENEVGRTVAEMLMHPNMKSFLPLPDGYEIAEIHTPIKVTNKTISEIGLRQRYNLNLITIKRIFEEKVNGEVEKVEHIVGVPSGDTILYETDIIIVLGKINDVDRFVEINK